MFDKFSINNKTCFLLGGCGLIGESVVNLFSNFNTKIIILDINKERGVKFSKNNNNIFFEKFDCGSKKDLNSKLFKILKKYGCPDIFVNCAHPTPKNISDKSFFNLKKDLLDEYIKIHMNSSAWISRVIAEEMYKKKINGSIILFGSIYGILGQDINVYKNTPMKESVPYSLIKGGLVNYVRQMASYYGKKNIRINSISPGGIEGHTKDNQKKQNKNFIRNYCEKVPIGRLAKSEEISYSVLFLASNASSYITGHNLIVDGGWSII